MKTLLLRGLRFALTLAKPKSGLARIAFHRFVQETMQRLPRPLVARVAGRFDIEVNPDDFNGRKLWLSGTNDWKITDTTIAMLDDGDTLLDIGANYGSVGLAASARVGRTGHIHLFEPQPDLVGRLTRAVDASNATNITLHQVALSDQDGQVELAIVGHHSGVASIVNASDDGTGDKITVHAHKTRDYVAPLVGDKPFGVKIDVEGAEPLILPDLLTFSTLKFVVFEGNQNVDTLFDKLQEQDFQIFGFCKTMLRTQVAPVQTAQDRTLYHDFIAVNPSQAKRLNPLMRKS